MTLEPRTAPSGAAPAATAGTSGATPESFDGIALATLGAALPTPFHAYSANDIRSRIDELQAALHGLDAMVCFAVKANPNLAILQLMAQAGLGADIVSAGEMQRSLRAGIDRSALGERQISIDCDVIQADGGTRCASITGGWVALRLAVNKLIAAGLVTSDPLIDHVAAVSCGIYAGQPVVDLDYAEDSEAGTDGNFVMTGAGQLIEVQMSAEGATFSRDQMSKLLDLAEAGVAELVAAQKAAI